MRLFAVSLICSVTMLAVCTCGRQSKTTTAPAVEEAEGHEPISSLDCFPMTDGAWLCLYQRYEGAYGEAGIYTFSTYFHKDGQVKKADGILPVPQLDELIDQDLLSSENRQLMSKFSVTYSERPRDFLIYAVYPDQQIVIPELHPLDLEAEENSGAWEDAIFDCRKIFEFLPIYKWNGQEFIKGTSEDFQ